MIKEDSEELAPSILVDSKEMVGAESNVSPGSERGSGI